jgi:hypothetical protein
MHNSKRKPLMGVSICLALVLLITGCNAAPPQPFKLNGIWGGVMNYAGADYFVFAMDVATSTAGTVSGYGLLTDDPTGQTGAFVTVTGSTQPTVVSLTLTDLYNDTVRLSGNVEGAVVRGTWTYPSGSVNGSFRMAAEENVELLGRYALDSGQHARTLSSLLQ